MIHLLFRLDGEELLTLTKVYMGLSALTLLYGLPLVAAGLSLIAVTVLHDKNVTLTSSVEQWLMVSSISAMASLGSWILLWHASRQDHDFNTWFFGMTLQKLCGMVIGYFLWEDSVETKKIDSGNTLCVLSLKVIQGRNLVAKDTNIFGRPTASDPYVLVDYGHTRMGTTQIINKTLDPVWNSEFRLGILSKTTEHYTTIHCHIYDHDHMSSDDSMGTVVVPIPPIGQRSRQGYPVTKGDGQHFCHDATGDLMVEVEVREKK